MISLTVLSAVATAAPAASVMLASVRRARRAERRAAQLTGSLEVARYAATHDALTGVLNRAGFLKLAGERLAAPGGTAIAVGLADLDRFKAINDQYGHGAGDRVLRAVADRLCAVCGQAGLVGRLGGDEFAFELPIGETRRLTKALAVRVPVSRGVVVEATASVGLAEADGDADVAALLGRADAAMYRGKRCGAGVAIYDPRLDSDDVSAPGQRPAVRLRDVPARWKEAVA